MMLLLFILLSIAMIVAGFGYKKTSETLFVFSLITAVFYFVHLMTSTIDIQL